MPDPSRRRAALYARFSSDLQNDRSITDQLAICETYAANHDLQIVERYHDRAKTSATLFGRDGLLSLITDAKADKFDVVVIEALDRLSRNPADLHGLFQQLDFIGVTIEEVHRGEADALTIGINSIFGQMFLKGLAEKTWRGHAGNIREGQSAGGKPYGYATVPGERGKLVINPEEADIVRRIFTEYAAGRSPRDICGDLNREGVPSPRGSVWRASVLTGNVKLHYGMLLNDLYRGERIWNRVKMVRNPDTGKRVNRANPPEDWHRADMPELRIVPEDLWQKVLKRRKSLRSGGNKPVRRVTRWFSGLMFCGHCGGRINIGSTYHTGKVYVNCARARESKLCDQSKSYRMDLIERDIFDQLRDLLQAPEYVAAYVREYHEERRRIAQANAGTRNQLLKAASKARGKFDRAHKLYIEGITDGAEARDALRKLRIEAEAAEQRAQAEAPPPSTIVMHPAAPARYAAALADLGADLVNPTDPHMAEAATILRELISAIRLQRDDAGAVKVEVDGYLSAFINQRYSDGDGGVTSFMSSAENISIPLLRFGLAS